MAADPVAKLRTSGRNLSLKVRAEVLALAPEIIPRLIDILNDVEGGWASVHAADLLIDLEATEAIEPMLRGLGEIDFDDELFNRIAVRLPELSLAAEHFREKDAGRGPAQQMADYAKPILDATDGSSGSVQAALNLAMLFRPVRRFCGTDG